MTAISQTAVIITRTTAVKTPATILPTDDRPLNGGGRSGQHAAQASGGGGHQLPSATLYRLTNPTNPDQAFTAIIYTYTYCKTPYIELECVIYYNPATTTTTTTVLLTKFSPRCRKTYF